jgi:CBS domain containing-hemolysin-like protein
MPVSVALLRVAAALALVAMNGFFVVAEFSLVSVRRTRIDELVATGNRLARIARHAIDDPDRFIAATQLGITLSSLGLGWIGEPAFAHLLRPLVAVIPAPWDSIAVHSVAAGLAFALITFLHVVLGELAPKSIALQYPERASLWVARPIVFSETLFRPAIWLLNGAANGLLRLLGVHPASGRQHVHSIEEIKMLMRESQRYGAMEADQEEMLQKVFRFQDRQVHEAMIPRPDVIGVDRNATVQELLQIFAAASHARFPVFEDHLDQIVGIIAIKDVLRAFAEDPARMQAPVGSLLRPALFVPETVTIADLFDKMRTSHNQMAVVFDEYGGTAGIVTLEELIEEIVGRLSDELVAQEQPMRPIDDRTVEVDAQLRIDEVNEELHLDLPEGEEYETVAGLILYHLQRVPAEGESLVHGDLEITVAQMIGPKIERVRIRR